MKESVLWKIVLVILVLMALLLIAGGVVTSIIARNNNQCNVGSIACEECDVCPQASTALTIRPLMVDGYLGVDDEIGIYDVMHTFEHVNGRLMIGDKKLVFDRMNVYAVDESTIHHRDVWVVDKESGHVRAGDMYMAIGPDNTIMLQHDLNAHAIFEVA